MIRKWSTIAAVVAVAMVPSFPAVALQTIVKDEPIVAAEVFEGMTFGLALKDRRKLQSFTVMITGPRDYRATVMGRTSLPKFDLRNFGVPTDGIYNYQVTASSAGEIIKVINPPLNNGRDDIPGAIPEGFQLTKGAFLAGQFCVKDGKIVPIDNETPETDQR